MNKGLALLIAATLFAGCQTEDKTKDLGPAPEAPRCNPLDPSMCTLPWPSGVYEKTDETSPTGRRLALRADALPVNKQDIAIDPWVWNEKDGFSINSAMILSLPGFVVTEDMPTPFHLDRYDAANAPVVVINADTGERLPIWVETDATAETPEEMLTFIRPSIPMAYGQRYIVALRNLKDASGKPYAPSEAFRTIRDGEDTSNAWLAYESKRYAQDIFPILEDAGFERSELYLAWDFHTMSRNSAVGRMEQIRDMALAWGDEHGFDYDFAPTSWMASDGNETGVIDYDCSVEGTHIARDVAGWFEAPYFTEKDEEEAALTEEREGFLTRDADGNPYVKGTKHVKYFLRIPCSAKEAPEAGMLPVVQYGHGLLGGYDEARGGYLAEMADRYGFALLAMNWTGFDTQAYGSVVGILASQPGSFAATVERSEQGMTELQLGVRFVQRTLADDDVAKFDGVTVLSKDTAYYYGNSQGGIMGSALLAQSKDFKRGVLGVVGGPYSLLLPRSKDFDTFFGMLKQKYVDHRDVMMFVAGLVQQVWDPVEPGGWMWDMTAGANPKQVLMQVGIYDNQVTTFGAEMMARAYGAFTPAPAVRPIWGVEEKDVGSEGLEGSAIVEWLYPDLPPEFEAASPPGREEDLKGTSFEGCQNTDPHEKPRREPLAQDQLWHFLTTGKVIQTCDLTTGCVSEVKMCFP